jgi:hypothetical protein
MQMCRFVFLAALFTNMCLYGNAQDPGRKITQVVSSTTNPKMQIEVDSNLSFLGRIESNVDTIGKFEEFIFSEIKDGKPGRTLILHFEYFLPENKLHFIYPRFRMAKIGNYEYLHQIWFVRNFDLMAIKEVSGLFQSKGLPVEPDWLVNRYVRAVDQDKKHELIIFYLEPGSIVPEEIRKIGMGNMRQTDIDPWQADLKERANKTFRILTEEQVTDK